MIHKPLALTAALVIFTCLVAGPANATLTLYNVNGTIGSDTLSGTLTFDSSIPANGLQAVYSNLNLTLTGPQTSVDGLISGTFTHVQYWVPEALPPVYGVLTDSRFGTINGYSNTIGLYIPAHPASILGSPFLLLSNQQLVENGTGVYDNVIEGSATLTAAVPAPETYAMMLAGLGLVSFARRRRKQQAA